MKILFRCDGGKIKEIGTGHVVRCCLLGEYLRKKGHIIAFAIQKDERGIREIESRKLPIIRLQKKNKSSSFLKAAKRTKPDIVVLDCLDREVQMIKPIQQTGAIVLVMDAKRPQARIADMCVNGMIRDPLTPYSGYKYTILPEYSVFKKQIQKTVKTIFISFGGFDYGRVTDKILEVLKPFYGKVRIIVVSNSKAGDQKKAKAIKGKSSHSIEYHYNVQHFDRLLEQSDVAIVSGGLTLFHALSLGIPSCVVSQYPHQESNALLLEREGALIYLECANQIQHRPIGKKIETLISNVSMRKKISERGQQLVDRHGLSRVGNLIQIIEELSWDSRFFRKKVARLFPSRLTKEILNYALRYCKTNKIDGLYYLADSQDRESANLAAKNGFNLVDIRVTYSRNIEKHSQRPYKCLDSRINIREGNVCDIPHLCQISRNSFIHSRFYHDGHFTKKACERLYSEWISQSFKGSSKKVFIAVFQDGPVGYVTCDCDGLFSAKMPLVNVSQRFQGKGVGTQLIFKTLNWCKRRGIKTVEVVTQGRNVAAQKLYQRCGFTTLKTELYYHKWFN